jgi:hypothetical protein
MPLKSATPKRSSGVAESDNDLRAPSFALAAFRVSCMLKAVMPLRNLSFKAARLKQLPNLLPNLLVALTE